MNMRREDLTGPHRLVRVDCLRRSQLFGQLGGRVKPTPCSIIPPGQHLTLPVLVLKLLQRVQFAHPKPAVERRPAVKHLLRKPHSAQSLSHRRSRLRLLQRIGNLLFCRSTLLHGMPLQHEGHMTGKRSFKPEQTIGVDVTQWPRITILAGHPAPH
jgi:hypothetical protein